MSRLGLIREPEEKKKFITELVESVKKEMLNTNLPDNWDGIELRWFIADKFAEVVFGEIGKRKGKRYGEYLNEIYVKNLL